MGEIELRLIARYNPNTTVANTPEASNSVRYFLEKNQKKTCFLNENTVLNVGFSYEEGQIGGYKSDRCPFSSKLLRRMAVLFGEQVPCILHKGSMKLVAHRVSQDAN